nr:response regulator transcription factor [uncultured Blautia sp.]
MELYERKILLVDDNRELVEMITDILKQGGYKNIVKAGSVHEALEVFQREKLDMAVLDVMLPDGDGFRLFQRMREQSDIPILFLSAKDEDRDRLFGLGLGADDYITKPFLPPELVLRVSAILKRSYRQEEPDKNEENCLCLGNHEILFDYGIVRYRGEETPFTAKELILLKKLNENRGRIVTFDALCNAAWGDGYYGYENTLMVHIRHLREKIEEDPSHPQWLLTARGLGYRLAADRGGRV